MVLLLGKLRSLLIIIYLFQLRPAEPSAILWIIKHSGQEPVEAEKRARRGREPQHMASGKARQGEDKGIERC